LDLSPSGEQQPQWAPDFQRELTHRFGQLKGQHLVVWDTASIQALDGGYLTGP
jgi:hypothetical protein